MVAEPVSSGDIDLEGRVALVTGASRGIGLAIAQGIVASGGRVLITSRSEQNLARALVEFRDVKSVHTLVAHVGSRQDAARSVASAIDRFGRLDVLVNNAGTNPYFGPLVDIDDARMQKTYEVNQASIVTHTSAAWHQWMAEHGGVVVNISSIGGLAPEPGIGWYNATKAAVSHLTKQFAWELSPRVRVNAIAPGLVRTELARGIWEANEVALRAHIPLGRLGEASDIAAMALFLMSDGASWITGQTFVVDGGTTTQPSGGVG